MAKHVVWGGSLALLGLESKTRHRWPWRGGDGWIRWVAGSFGSSLHTQAEDPSGLMVGSYYPMTGIEIMHVVCFHYGCFVLLGCVCQLISMLGKGYTPCTIISPYCWISCWILCQKGETLAHPSAWLLAPKWCLLHQFFQESKSKSSFWGSLSLRWINSDAGIHDGMEALQQGVGAMDPSTLAAPGLQQVDDSWW